MKKTAVLACLAMALAAPAAFAQAPAASPSASPTAKPDAGTAPPKSNSPAASVDQFATEAAAKAHCPSDTVVWANLSSKAYHTSGDKYYGKTKHGAYMCQKDANSDGFHMGGKKAAAATKS